MNYEEMKTVIERKIQENLNDLIVFNDDVADHPELSSEEFETSRKIVSLMKKKGFQVVTPFADLPTSFKAVYGKNDHKHKIAILTEYDALPEIGHACGHCVSASISLLAGIACIGLQDELNSDIHVIGTPAEEVDGAKASMVDKGIFDNYDFAMMIHLYDQNIKNLKLLALNSDLYTFHGKAAHAAAAPWEGINALNAATLMTMAVDMMRQQCTPDVRMHYVYRNGGAAPNIIPEEASIEVYARALSRPYLNTLLKKLDKIAEGAALMTGCTYSKIPTAAPYDNMLNNSTALNILQEVWEEIGIEDNGDYGPTFGSSDIGNVSFACPTLHPTLQLVDRGVAIHTRNFAKGVKTEKAHECIENGARIIAFQIAKMFSNEETIQKMKEEFLKIPKS